MEGHRYFVLNKPFDMVSQFVSTHDVRLLTAVNFNFPEDTHAIGRLDKNSEGLLLLTTNKKVTKLLFSSKLPHKRTYLVQVANKVSAETITKLTNGVAISAVGGKQYITNQCEVALVDKPSFIEELKTIPLHKNVTNSWLSITLTEGKFHQIRKMTAAVKHKCLRLVRVSIEGIELGELQPGQVKEVSHQFFFEKLKL